MIIDVCALLGDATEVGWELVSSYEVLSRFCLHFLSPLYPRQDDQCNQFNICIFSHVFRRGADRWKKFTHPSTGTPG